MPSLLVGPACRDIGSGVIMEMDLFGDLADKAKEELSERGLSPEEEDKEDLVLRWLDLENQMPAEIEWEIEESRKIQERREELPDDILRGLQQFNQRAQDGESLIPHVSRGIRRPEDMDHLLLDWNVMHFHLGEEEEEDGFIERTDELLFAMLDPSDGIMYQLDVHPHEGGFSRQDLVDIIEEDWPGLLDDSELKGVDVEGRYTDEEVREWRELGVNPVVSTDEGRAVASMGGGITAAGTSMSSRRYVDQARRDLREVESSIQDCRESLEEYFRTEHNREWDDLEFQLTKYGERVQVHEANTDEVVFDQSLSEEEDPSDT